MNDNKLLIGIRGEMHAGKDTLALAMKKAAENMGILTHIRPLAMSLKEEVAEFLMTHLPTDHVGFNSKQTCIALQCDVTSKEQFRLLMQWWGTEFRRVCFGNDYWIRQHRIWVESNLCQSVEAERKEIIFVPDVRFLNECDYIKKDWNGALIQITRADLPITNHTHPSEVELANYKEFDVYYKNDYSLDVMEKEAAVLMANLIDWKWGNEASHTAIQR